MALHLTITTAQYNSSCPDCGGEIRRGDAIATARGDRYFSCLPCVAEQLLPLMTQLDPLQRALDDLMDEYRLQDLAGVALRTAVLRRDDSVVGWAFSGESGGDGPVVALTEPFENCIKVTTYLPFRRHEVRSIGDTQ